MDITDKISETWDWLCRSLVPCHNPDIILKLQARTLLYEMQMAGAINRFQVEVTVIEPNHKYRLHVRYAPTIAVEWFEYACDGYVTPIKRKPLNPNERFDFDD